MKRFKTIDVMGIKFKVTWTKDEMPDDCRDDFGGCSTEYRHIYINAEKCEDNEETIRRTVYHELNHAVLGITGLDTIVGAAHDEALAQAAEHAWPEINKFLITQGYYKKYK